MLIDEFNIETFPKVKRYGLPIFEKELLVQFYQYVDGLYSANVMKEPEKALQKLSKAIICSKTLCH